MNIGSWESGLSLLSVGGGLIRGGTGTTPFSFTPTTPVNQFEVFHTLGPEQGAFKLNIDGSGSINVSSYGDNAILSNLITAGSVATHTLNITRDTGTSYLVGIIGRDTTKKEISVINAGISGVHAPDWVPASPFYFSPLYAIPAVNPDLTIINLTINDAIAGTSLATYFAAVQAIIDIARKTGDVALVSGAPSNTADVSQSTQSAVLNVFASIARLNDVPFFNANDVFVSYAYMATQGWSSDSYHPSASGYVAFANWLTQKLVPSKSM